MIKLNFGHFMDRDRSTKKDDTISYDGCMEICINPNLSIKNEKNIIKEGRKILGLEKEE